MFTLQDLRASTATTVTVTQAADVLADLSGHRPDPRTVRRAAATGQLPAVHVGRRLLIVRERLVAMLSAEGAPVTPRRVRTTSQADGCQVPPSAGDAA